MFTIGNCRQAALTLTALALVLGSSTAFAGKRPGGGGGGDRDHNKAADAHQLPRDGENGLHHYAWPGIQLRPPPRILITTSRAPTTSPRPFCPKRPPATRSPRSLRAMNIGSLSMPKMQPGTSQARPTSAPSFSHATPLRRGPPPSFPSVKLAPITPTSPGPAPQDDGPYHYSYELWINGSLLYRSNYPRNVISTVLRYLQPDTTYAVQIRTIDFGNNPSPLSDPVSFTTLPANPNDTTPPTVPAPCWRTVLATLRCR